MKERPILFSAPMVRAILSGFKTETRRIIKLPEPGDWSSSGGWHRDYDSQEPFSFWRALMPGGPHGGTGSPLRERYVARCPYGQRGDRLWVRETWAPGKNGILYRADAEPWYYLVKWRPSIFMPRAASRLLLEVKDVRFERLRSMSDFCAIAEGFCDLNSFREGWDDMHGKGAWESNPWVWAVQFERVGL